MVWDSAAVRAFASGENPNVAAVLDHISAILENGMKRRCPVSRVVPIYATRGATVPGGRRFAGDAPLRPSGYLRSSIHRFRVQGGDILIGPTADYAEYVNDGTLPHEITSHGSWPLRNRATGQVFGRHVNHPGTRPTRFVERSVEDVQGMVFRVG